MLVLKEFEVGSDQTELRYPGIISCMTVTCLTRNVQLVGAHLTVDTRWEGGGGDRNSVATQLGRLGDILREREIHKIYVVGNFNAWKDEDKGGSTKEITRRCVRMVDQNYRGV